MIYQQLVAFDHEFNLATRKPVVINDIPDETLQHRDYIDSITTTRRNTDVNEGILSSLPRCDCGNTTGEYKKFTLCPDCKTEVRPPIESKIEPLVWFRSPVGVEPLINPEILIELSEHFTKGSFNLIQYLMDVNYKPPVKLPVFLNEVTQVIQNRGYNYFVKNFDSIINYLFSLKTFRKQTSEKTYKLIMEYRECVFSRHLPFPNKSILIVEDGHTGSYIDTTLISIKDAINTIRSIDNTTEKLSVRTKENRVVKTLFKIIQFCKDYTKNSLGKKPGLYRKHLYGTRTHFCARTVITSITEKHDYDEIHIPWSIAVNMLRLHLTNLLHARNFSVRQIHKLLDSYTNRYHPLLDELFKFMINTSEAKGIWCIAQRNPSLHRGSAQLVRITKVKTDIYDWTTSVPIKIVVPWNADFDGDSLNFSLPMDNLMVEHFKNLAPHKSMFNLSAPRAISSAMTIPRPVISTTSNWLAHEDEVDPVIEQRMLTLCE